MPPGDSMPFRIELAAVKLDRKWKDTYKQSAGLKINEPAKSENLFSLYKKTRLMLKAKLFCSIPDIKTERFSPSYVTDQLVIGQAVNAISPFYL